MQTIIFEAQSKEEVAQIQPQTDSTHVLLQVPPQNVQRTLLWNPCVYDAETSGSGSFFFFEMYRKVEIFLIKVKQ